MAKGESLPQPYLSCSRTRLSAAALSGVRAGAGEEARCAGGWGDSRPERGMAGATPRPTESPHRVLRPARRWGGDSQTNLACAAAGPAEGQTTPAQWRAVPGGAPAEGENHLGGGGGRPRWSAAMAGNDLGSIEGTPRRWSGERGTTTAPARVGRGGVRRWRGTNSAPHWWGPAAMECGGGRDTRGAGERGGAEAASERRRARRRRSHRAAGVRA